MKAVRLVEVGKPLQDAEVELPHINPSEVLIRVTAAGVCHSDLHYRTGVSPAVLPVTLGHEIAGKVETVGKEVENLAPGDRVSVHYLVTCGRCDFCLRGHEQFCATAKMIGKHRDGGYAQFINMPARNVFVLPDEISFEAGAIMMCSSATALHALNKVRVKPGDSVAIFGFGGLGFSTLQLSRALGCAEIYVVDINPAKLATAAAFGGVPIDAKEQNPVDRIRKATAGKGVDVAIELVGSAITMRQAVESLGIHGRAAMVGLTAESLSVLPYPDLINKEGAIIGISDHLASELAPLMEFARTGQLRFPEEVLRFVDLNARQINSVLDAMNSSTGHMRTVILPHGANA